MARSSSTRISGTSRSSTKAPAVVAVVPRLPTAAAHADRARDHAKLAAHHSGEAARMSRDQAREAPSKSRRSR
jgi:hypothetical protein